MAIRATVVCDASIGPGRVRCTADAAVPGAEIRWADVEIVDSPAFITPLKGRLPPSDAVRRSGDAWLFGFAVVARERGQGELIIRVRVVACQGGTCVPLLGSAKVNVKVGD
jgi:hypothetical protein